MIHVFYHLYNGYFSLHISLKIHINIKKNLNIIHFNFFFNKNKKLCGHYL